MDSQSLPAAPEDFLTLARRLNLLDELAAERLATESRDTNTSVSEAALRSGLLDGQQIDIVELLLHPEEGVPGFELLELMGQGGMGLVFRARQKSLDRIVALKTVLVSRLQDSTTLSRFEQEAHAVAKLRHPNIVAAYDLGRHKGRMYFAMELVEGRDVESAIEEHGALDEVTAWSYIRQAAAGLSHAKDEGIIHRDVKPANMLLVRPPAGFELPGGKLMVKITDFGLAFLSQENSTHTRLTQANATIGSPHYIAPEQLEADDFDHRVDIYGLGASAYHMLAGEPPFHARKLSQIVALKLSSTTADVRDKDPRISEGTAELVMRMMQRDPHQRIGSYAELIAAIDRLTPPTQAASKLSATAPMPKQTMEILQDPTAELQSARPNERPARRAGHRRRWLWIAGFLLAGLIAVAWFLRPATVQPTVIYPLDHTRRAEMFNGRDISDWTVVSGAWRAGENEERGFVIVGGDGQLRHRLALVPGERPLEFYRVTAIVDPRSSESAGIEFGVENPGVGENYRYFVEVSKSRLTCGGRATKRGPIDLPTSVELQPGQQEIAIERQADCWRVFSGDREVAVLPCRKQLTMPVVQLHVTGQDAHFSDISLQALDSEPQPAK